MQNNKRHYFLKLTEDFFQQEKIIILENSKHGHIFSNILLKLYLLSMKNNGELLLSDEVPYTSEMMARLTGHKVTIVEQAIEKFKELELVEEMNNSTLKMMDFTQFIGSITSESVRKQAYRKRASEEQTWDNVTNQRLSSAEHGTEQGQVDSTLVPKKSLVIPSKVHMADNDLTNPPPVEGDNVPTIQNQPSKLKRPKKVANPTSQTSLPSKGEA